MSSTVTLSYPLSACRLIASILLLRRNPVDLLQPLSPIIGPFPPQVAPHTIGCILRHTAVRDAAAKGKIERFFRRVRDQFLVKKLDLSSLESLNRQFTDWVENDYNAVPHDAIGMKPIDRFGIDLARLRFLPPSEHNDELFYAEADRKVKKDNTFSFAGRRYETPVNLRDKKIQLRYDRRRLDTTAVIIYHKGQRLGAARLLDAVANGLLRRKEQS